MRKVSEAPVTCLERLLQNLGEYHYRIFYIVALAAPTCNNNDDEPRTTF